MDREEMEVESSSWQVPKQWRCPGSAGGCWLSRDILYTTQCIAKWSQHLDRRST